MTFVGEDIELENRALPFLFAHRGMRHDLVDHAYLLRPTYSGSPESIKDSKKQAVLRFGNGHGFNKAYKLL